MRKQFFCDSVNSCLKWLFRKATFNFSLSQIMWWRHILTIFASKCNFLKDVFLEFLSLDWFWIGFEERALKPIEERKQRVCVCVWESVHERERECASERESVWGCVRECASERESMWESVRVRESVCENERVSDSPTTSAFHVPKPGVCTLFAVTTFILLLLNPFLNLGPLASLVDTRVHGCRQKSIPKGDLRAI